MSKVILDETPEWFTDCPFFKGEWADGPFEGLSSTECRLSKDGSCVCNNDGMFNFSQCEKCVSLSNITKR